MNMALSQFLLTLIFLTIGFFAYSKEKFHGRDSNTAVQSLAIVILLAESYIITGSGTFLLIALLGLIVKVILAPYSLSIR